MAIISVKKMVGRDSPKDEDGAAEYIDRYMVIANSKDDQGAAIRNASYGGVSVPAYGEGHPNDPDALVRRKRAREEATNGTTVWKWIVEVEYSTVATSETGDGSGGDDPFYARPVRKWSTTTVMKTVEKAILLGSGSEEPVPVANTAGEVFIPGIEEPFYLDVLTITRNEPLTGWPHRVRGYRGAICEHSLYGFNEFEPMMASIEAEEKTRGSLIYLSVTYEIHFDTSIAPWARVLLNHGYRHREGTSDDGQIVNIDNGLSRNLDMQGHVLADDEPAVFLVWETRKTMSFAPLQLEF